MTDGTDTHDVLARWAARLSDELGFDVDQLDIDALLDIAGEAAHGIVRPAAPLTTFLIGYAAAKSVTSGEARQAPAVQDAITRARETLADLDDG